MAHSKLYRSFIILQEDERGHSVSKEKPLSGYAKIEVKGNSCKVAFYAQNLKKEYANCQMVLICNKKDTKSILDLGTMNITEQGKVESSIEHDAENIGNTQISFDKIVGAAICKHIGGKFVYLMCGFLNGEQPSNNWKEYSKIACSTEKKEEKKSYVEKNNNKPKVIENKDEIKEDCCNKKEEKHCDKKIEIKEEKVCPIKNVQEADNDKEKEKNEFDQYEDSINVEELTRGTDDFEMRGAMAEFFLTVVDGLEDINVRCEIKNTKWYKVPVNSFDEMCNVSNYNKYTTLYYPMINYYPYIIKKGHFLVGLKCNENGKVKYVVYAIAGTKDKMDQPYNGKTGFVTFVPESEGSNNGHWLMFYDFRNSMVVVPMK
ncbi:MAG: hypothetical protein ACRC57_06970 [Sarcina sp.]